VDQGGVPGGDRVWLRLRDRRLRVTERGGIRLQERNETILYHIIIIILLYTSGIPYIIIIFLQPFIIIIIIFFLRVGRLVAHY